MRPLIQEVLNAHSPEWLVGQLRGEPGRVLLRSASFEPSQGRYSLVAVRPMLRFRAMGSRCELASDTHQLVQFGNPWRLLDAWLGRFELLEELDVPFPLGGCFGYWGYDLKHFVEPRLSRRAANDLDWPDCQVGFYDSLVVFDHALGKTWIVSTGLQADGSRSELRAQQQFDFWRRRLEGSAGPPDTERAVGAPEAGSRARDSFPRSDSARRPCRDGSSVSSTFAREDFLAAVERAQRYIRAGDIYQVNLSQRLEAAWPDGGWEFYQRLAEVSPAPFAAYLDGGDFEVASSSPELFLRLSGAQVHTRPIKGTRPRSADPDRDAQLAFELQTSAKEMAELVMITDLLRNDLGKVCEYGSVLVPELARLERYAQVQHLVSTVEGRLRPGVTHLAALGAGFPGGSITGAPKFRAMEIIDELEPVTRGPYTGCLGYLGFNRESQVSILIRTALCRQHRVCFQVGAGIVADSDPASEYAETLAKAGGFLAALGRAREAERIRVNRRTESRSVSP